MWVEESVFYQIYPLGFCGAPKENDGVLEHRILKVKEFTDYFKEIGIGAILFNPVFESDRHGYDTRNFDVIDVRLGTDDDFKEVCDDIHAKGMKVVLDGVFNHVGRGFYAFQDVLKHRERSPYKDWFYINFAGNSYKYDGLWYEGWEGHYELVKLNLHNEEVVNHLLSCVKDWILKYDIDGIRLDVAYSLNHDFIRRLRAFCNEIKPDFFLVGEMLHGDYNTLLADDMLHSVTNYECYKGLYSSFNEMNMFEIAHSLNRQFGAEDWCLYRGKHLLNFLDNHDVTRIASILKNPNHIYPAYSMLMTMPGIPCIYYGSEWGIMGDKNADDSELRPSLDKPAPNEITDYIKGLIEIRNSTPALIYGNYRNVVIDNKFLVFERVMNDDNRVLVAINADEEPKTINVDIKEIGTVELKPYQTRIIEF
jgi:glycosidase